MKKLLSILLCAVMIFSLTPAGTTYAAGSWPSNTSIEADGGILIDADSGTVLYSKNIHNTYYPASITKILTAYIIIKENVMEHDKVFGEITGYCDCNEKSSCKK